LWWYRFYNFGEEGIPLNVLVDPAGKKSLLKRLRGPELEAKLERGAEIN